MAGQTWAIDQDGGFLANPPLSQKLRHATQPKMQFRQITRVEPGFGKNKGEQLDFDKVMNVQTGGGKFAEENKIPETKFLIKQASLLIDQYGLSVPFTGKLEVLSEFDPRNPIQTALTNDMAKTIDKAVSDEAKTGKIIAVPTLIDTVAWDSDGTPTDTATVNINMIHIKDIVDAMKVGIFGSTVLRPVPPMPDGFYVCVASVKFLRGIIDDPDFQDAADYAAPDMRLSGEIGRNPIYKVRFLEHTFTTSLSNGKGTGSVLGEAIFFGDDAIIEGVAIPEEIRAKVPTNYGLDKGIAWYFLGGWKRAWDASDDTETRIVRVTSA